MVLSTTVTSPEIENEVLKNLVDDMTLTGHKKSGFEPRGSGIARNLAGEWGPGVGCGWTFFALQF